MITQVSVLRISASGLSSATFCDYPEKMAEWARISKLDRVDYPFFDFNQKPDEKTILEGLKETIKRFPKEGGLIIGVPGPTYENSVLFCPQVPILVGDFVKQNVRKMRPQDFTVFNNTNLWAEAELHQGAIRGKNKTSLLISLGRGIGSALVIDGKIHLGSHGLAGEIGHISLDPFDGPTCECGQKGCLELYVSGPALMKLAREKGIKIDEPSGLINMQDAAPLVEDARQYLVGVIASVIIPYDISDVVLGGQLAELYGSESIQKILNEEIPYFLRQVCVYPAEYSAQEGTLVGGGIIGFRFLNIEPSELKSKERKNKGSASLKAD